MPRVKGERSDRRRRGDRRSRCRTMEEEAKKKELTDLEVAHKSKLEELEAVKVFVG